MRREKRRNGRECRGDGKEGGRRELGCERKKLEDRKGDRRGLLRVGKAGEEAEVKEVGKTEDMMLEVKENSEVNQEGSERVWQAGKTGF